MLLPSQPPQQATKLYLKDSPFTQSVDAVPFASTAGAFTSSFIVLIKQLQLPEFSKSAWCDNIFAYAVDNLKKRRKYDYILGRTFFISQGI